MKLLQFIIGGIGLGLLYTVDYRIAIGVVFFSLANFITNLEIFEQKQ